MLETLMREHKLIEEEALKRVSNSVDVKISNSLRRFIKLSGMLSYRNKTT
jgi:hypothetical protein